MASTCASIRLKAHPIVTASISLAQIGRTHHDRLFAGKYTFCLEAFDLAGNVSTSEPYEVQISAVNEVYLPIIMHNWVSVIESNWLYLPLIRR